jgi:hypothetical protein
MGLSKSGKDLFRDWQRETPHDGQGPAPQNGSAVSGPL